MMRLVTGAESQFIDLRIGDVFVLGKDAPVGALFGHIAKNRKLFQIRTTVNKIGKKSRAAAIGLISSNATSPVMQSISASVATFQKAGEVLKLKVINGGGQSTIKAAAPISADPHQRIREQVIVEHGTEYVVIRKLCRRDHKAPQTSVMHFEIVPKRLFDDRQSIPEQAFAKQMIRIVCANGDPKQRLSVSVISNIVPDDYFVYNPGERVGRQVIREAYVWCYDNAFIKRAKAKKNVIAVFRTEKNMGFCVDDGKPGPRPQSLNLKQYRYQF